MNRTPSRLLIAAFALAVSSLAFAGEKKDEPAVAVTNTHCGASAQSGDFDCGQICIKGQESGKKVTCQVKEENKTKQGKTSGENWV